MPLFEQENKQEYVQIYFSLPSTRMPDFHLICQGTGWGRELDRGRVFDYFKVEIHNSTDRPNPFKIDVH